MLLSLLPLLFQLLKVLYSTPHFRKRKQTGYKMYFLDFSFSPPILAPLAHLSHLRTVRTGHMSCIPLPYKPAIIETRFAPLLSLKLVFTLHYVYIPPSSQQPSLGSSKHHYSRFISWPAVVDSQTLDRGIRR